MFPIQLDPGKFLNFGDAEDSAFVFVTNEEVGSAVILTDEGRKYTSCTVEVLKGEDDFSDILSSKIPVRAHVLTVLPDYYFSSPSTDLLGPSRKLGVLACNSTPTTLEAVEHFLRQAAQTIPATQEMMAERFFSRAEQTTHIEFVDTAHRCSARFNHRAQDFEWHEQVGVLRWGEQQLLPSGEVSTLAVAVFGENIVTALPIQGKLALRGPVVLHAGRVSFLREDQARLYEALRGLEHEGVIATVENGQIIKLDATGPLAVEAAKTLDALFEVDSRYRMIVEVGFGVNTELKLFPSNSAMNEVYGGHGGTVHFGLGLSPYTQYHLDLICPATAILAANGTQMFAKL